MNSPAVTIRGLRKLFPLPWKRKTLIALDHLDLDIQAGEIFGLLGPNGSGKSTTLKLILGLLEPTAGEIRIFGTPPSAMETKRRIGFLPENPYFHKFLTGEETLSFYGRLCSMTASELRPRIAELLDLVGLSSSGNRPISTYSKGMLQRIGLAQALIHQPDLLILDEPTAAVDPIGAREIRDILVALKKQGKTILFSSHLLEQVEEISDRVAILHGGKKIIDGRVRDLLQKNDRLRFEISGLSAEQIRQAEESLRSLGGQEITITPASFSLERLFLNSVGKRDKT